MRRVAVMVFVLAAAAAAAAIVATRPRVAAPARDVPEAQAGVEEQPRMARAAPSAAGGNALAAVVAPTPRPAPLPADAAVPTVAAPAPGEGHPRQRLRRLLDRGSARDVLQAHAVLDRCVQARDLDRFVAALEAGPAATLLRRRYGDGAARVAAACADLSARELEQRVVLAARAADEGVPGAASAWVEDGPFGDPTALTQRPDDPLVAAWAQQAIERITAATKRADTEAIGQFGLLCLNWELDDVSRLRLVVDAGLQRRREEALRRLQPE